jgi:hypothetical protein
MKLLKVSLAEKTADGSFEVYDEDQKEEKYDGLKYVQTTRLVFTGTPEKAQAELDEALATRSNLDKFIEEKQAIVDLLK